MTDSQVKIESQFLNFKSHPEPLHSGLHQTMVSEQNYQYADILWDLVQVSVLIVYITLKTTSLLVVYSQFKLIKLNLTS